MARIAILVAGSRGDVQPAVALALRLRASGHKCWVATHAALHPLVRTLSSDAVPLARLGGGLDVLLRVAVVRYSDDRAVR